MRAMHPVNYAGLIISAGLTISLFVGAATAQEVVEVDNRPVWGDNVSLVEDVRIGAADGELEYLFGSIAAVRSLPDGSILVADRQGPIIRRYASTGEYMSDVGAPGSGPGEYASILGLEVLPGGEFVVWDPRNRRLNVYASDGTDLDSFPVDSGTFSSDVLHVDENSTSWVLATDVESGRLENGNFRQHYILVARSGEIMGQVPIPEDHEQPGFVLITPEGARRPFMAGRPHSVAHEGRLVLGDNMAYTLDFLENGSTVRTLERPYKPVETTGGEREQWNDVARRFTGRSGVTYPPTPGTKPAFRAIEVDSNGRIWVERYVEADHRPQEGEGGRSSLEWREPSVYDVIEPDGTFLGQVRLPFGAYFHDADGMNVYAEFSGEDDVPYVIRYRIETE